MVGVKAMPTPMLTLLNYLPQMIQNLKILLYIDLLLIVYNMLQSLDQIYHIQSIRLVNLCNTSCRLMEGCKKNS